MRDLCSENLPEIERNKAISIENKNYCISKRLKRICFFGKSNSKCRPCEDLINHFATEVNERSMHDAQLYIHICYGLASAKPFSKPYATAPFLCCSRFVQAIEILFTCKHKCIVNLTCDHNGLVDVQKIANRIFH